ncbi:MAG: DUF3465 domain-containing protein [Candidatus Obscuribacterales bacterium]|nr:DUF3465 domain-containing protein [Candidatus Obscuribacterales bacterium]
MPKARSIDHKPRAQYKRPERSKSIRGGYVSAMLACVFVFGTACSSQKTPSEFGEPRDAPAQQSVPAVAGGENVGQDQLLQAQANNANKVEVLFSAPVYKLLPDDRQGIPHQRFLLQLSNGSTVLVAHNTKMAPPVPIRAGDVVTIKGEYIWNEKGGVVHWTHHTDTPRHMGGFIDFNGQRYQ